MKKFIKQFLKKEEKYSTVNFVDFVEIIKES